MKRLRRLLGSAFGIAMVACLALAGWAVWSAGLFDGPVARQLRTSSVYVGPGLSVDQSAAEHVIGNRRLVVTFLPKGTDLPSTCDSLSRAADGTLTLLLTPDGDAFDKYGCAKFPGRDFGNSYVSETMIGSGIDGFVNQPINALKVVVVNYDLLVRAGLVPDGARTVTSSLPRYLVAAAAVVAVIAGAAALYWVGRRAAAVTEAHRVRRAAGKDAHAVLSASAAVLAQEIIDLDARYARAQRNHQEDSFARKYRRLASDYANLLPQLGKDGEDATRLIGRVDELLTRSQELSSTK